MVKTYDLYGSKSLSMQELRDATQTALTIEFELHESGFMGGDYLLAGDLGGEHFVIKPNRIGDGDEEVAEPTFAPYPLLLEINGTTRADDVKHRLGAVSGLDFLRRAVP